MESNDSHAIYPRIDPREFKMLYPSVMEEEKRILQIHIGETLRARTAKDTLQRLENALYGDGPAATPSAKAKHKARAQRHCSKHQTPRRRKNNGDRRSANRWNSRQTNRGQAKMRREAKQKMKQAHRAFSRTAPKPKPRQKTRR